MLWINSIKGWQALVNRQNFCIVNDFEGDLTLSFDIATTDSAYCFIKEEASLRFEDNDYVIKEVNRRKKLATITAYLDMDAWKHVPYVEFKTEDKLMSEVIDRILPQGWLVENTSVASTRGSIELYGVNAYEILMSCKNVYDVVFKYHTRDKKLKVLKPDAVLPRGLFMSDELNLNEVEYKGSSNGLITLLQVHGKKTEIKDEEGNIIRTDYVNFKDINNGKDYIENHTYSDKVIAAYWQDNSYEDATLLYHDAVERLKEMAIPQKSYSCKLNDLSRTNEKYRMLDFKMYDKPMLIDASGIHEQHQIVQYKRYPDKEGMNEVMLSTSFQKITGKIENMNSSMQKMDVSMAKSEHVINEVIKDVDANTARINQTYTKGEVDTNISSVVQQAADEINNSIQKIDEDTKTLGKRIDNTEQQLTPEQITNTVSSQFYKKDETDLMYSSKEEISSQFTQLKDSINITLKEMSGFNFIYNSSGWNATNFWYGEKKENGSVSEVIGDIVGMKDNDIIDHTVSGSAFRLNEGTMCQDVRLIPGNKYTITCMMKKDMSGCSMKLIQNDIISDVFSYDQTFTDLEWHAHELKFECLSSTVTIMVTSSASFLMIADIMLNDGEVAKTWTSNNDEIYAGNVRIDKGGIRIAQSDTDTQTIIDSSEFSVVYGKTGKKVVRVNKDTTLLQKVIAEDDLSIGNVKMIKRDSGIDFAIIEE